MLTPKPSPVPPVLCGTDFSSNAREAADVAAILARRLGARLELVHVAQELDEVSTTEIREAVLRTAQERLGLETRRVGQDLADVEPVMVEGGRAEEVLGQRIRMRRPGLVVVSSVSKTAFERWTLGTVSERMVADSPVPVLVVRDAEPFAAWHRGERKLRVFAAVDPAPGSESALRWLAALATLGPCEITLGLVARSGTVTLRRGLTPAEKPRQSSKRPLRDLEHELKSRANPILGQLPYAMRVRLADGSPDLPLLEMATRAHADLLVTGTHQRHGLDRAWHGSISQSLLRHARISVACIPMATGVQ